ncbi:Serine/threonine-protein kinase pkn1 [Micromonospora sp. MW-13]|uniref:formylglycine-generating enzyme family protein n=1 Tax=Micromonospora sp. MW-13 TaxID=2094022 RepID=UPI000ED8A507|nr:SUMF1/EgtB/PvdO family nonheme iron enzyme [Micromonospora sp. MW-13]RGC68140.1 Serine/threonine-protein kinase pkn1 [Micromonospora sp. MW-13]
MTGGAPGPSGDTAARTAVGPARPTRATGGADVVVHGEINSISDRAAMGLPAHYVSPRFEDLGAAVDALRDCGAPGWVAVVESAEASLESRLAAGLLLGIAGDPRIRPLDPEMITIPGATVRLGLDPSRVDELHGRYSRYGVQRNWIEKECPRFAATVGAFRIAKYPVTNAEYALFLADTEHTELPTSWPFGRVPVGCANHPVYTVTPAMADAYVRWLAASTGRPFRLPTEYEWEYAASAGREQDFPWGHDFRDTCANTMDLGLLSTTAVGTFPAGASPFGVLDMAGNVEEYVSTHYHAYPGGELVEDDLFRVLGHYRIARGGAFNRFSDLARCGRRHGPYPKSLYAIGLRVAEDASAEDGRDPACST